jgi:hypothetical protein
MRNPEKLFWEKYSSQVLNDSEEIGNLEKKFSQYSALIEENQNIYSLLKALLKDIPIGIALRYWLNTISCQLKQKKISHQIVQLIERKILPIQNKNGHVLSLDYFHEQGEGEHRKIVEEIKCVPDWSMTVKEELVKSYIEFSHHLNQNTFGIIPKAYDPDRFYASHKVINYDDFTKFVELLSERDALIAKLLYFGGPTVEEVLLLKYGQLNLKDYAISFSKQTIKYPKHLMLELSNFVGKKKKNDLIFLNYRGNQVVRTHLNHTFGRASKEINRTITPRDLVKLKLN